MFFRLPSRFLPLIRYLKAIVPSCCALCGIGSEDTLCNGCRNQAFSQSQHRCMQCALPLPAIAASAMPRCGNCLKQPPAFDATIVAANYLAPVDRLVLALKFGNQLALAPLFARMLHEACLPAQEVPLPLLLTAVPLGRQRLAERGFNQALEIAKPLSHALGIRLDPYLASRSRDTRAQALLPPGERHDNIRNAFIVADDATKRIRGRHIGVVDDVITTGETLNELARTLKRFGATRVTNFVFARAVQK
jgi:ComF family protein